ncbi:MAG: TRAP transporter small permease, partial [Betaproteobacteria bacterium]|nr:TRAP transporter small permease [Betaproteobacteria bacterium]
MPPVEAAETLPASSGSISAPRWLIGMDTFVGAIVEFIAALLVMVEILVLLAGVASRYLFRSPLIWSDELASLLFLWLAMLGAVVAFRRGEHMRMTAVVGNSRPSVRAFLDVFAIVAGLAFLLLIAWFAFEFAAGEVIVTTPALGISNAWRASALPVGCGLMIVIGLLRLARTAGWRPVLASVVVVAVASGALIALQPVFDALG